MKYIRTKDGRIIDLKNWSSFETTCIDDETNKMEKDICYQRNWFEYYGDACEYKTEYISHNSQVLNQADTIEELCDEFVGIDSSNYYYRFTELEKVNGNYSYLNEEYKAFYGAIWTKQGLIYVAKMNEKGELELL